MGRIFEHPPMKRRRWLRWRFWSLALCAAVLVLCRTRTWNEPAETDLAIYWVTAGELLEGRRLYADVWDIKPPLIYWLYAGARLFTARPEVARFTLWCVGAVAILLAVDRIGRRMTGSLMAGTVAALYWTLMANDCYLQANQPNVELFMNAAITWSLALLLEPLRVPPVLPLAAAGLALGAATLLKTVAWVHTFFFAIAATLAPHQRLSRSYRTRAPSLAPGLILLGTSLIPWLMVVAVFAQAGNARDLLATIFVWGRSYAGNIGENLLAALSPNRLLLPAAKNIAPTVVASIVGLALSRVSLTPLARPLLLAWMISTFLAYALPGRFYNHYFQLWMPLLCVLAGASYIGMRRINQSGRARRLSHLLLISGLAAQAVVQLPFYARPADLWSVAKYGPDFVEQQRLGEEVQKYLRPNERLYIWGTAPTIYEASRRRPASGMFFVIPLLFGPTTETLTRRALADLARNPPELLLIDTRDVPAPASHPMVQWFHEHYRGDPALRLGSLRFRAFCLKNGFLQQRLHQNRQPSGKGP